MKHSERINRRLETLYPASLSSMLGEAMRYSLNAGGKRIRPVLLLTTLEVLGGDIEDGLSTAAAIEMIHTYSLIHDDLPAMDDDDYRRGKATNHKVYGEAAAILAGDGLLTDSFLQIVNDDHLTNEKKVQLTAIAAEAAGSNGMVGGQMLDMLSENRQLSLEEMEQIHTHKTGDLIRACFLSAGVIAERSDLMQMLSELGAKFGLLFQIKDDILDVEGTFEEMGKSAGSDEGNQKSTYVVLLGLEQSKQMMTEIYAEAVNLIHRITDNGEPLIELLDYIINRNK